MALGPVTIVVNNAGIAVTKPLLEHTEEDWQSVIEVNLNGAWRVAQAAARHMIQHKQGGSIVNIASILGLRVAAQVPSYAASKAALIQLTKAMATGWAADNIQVNAVLPGWIDTELTQRARQQIEGLHESVLRRTPAKRWGVEQDMAGVAVFLASPASDFVTGAAIPVDGGYSIQG